MLPRSLVGLLAIARAAEHLAVLGRRTPALGPRRDVVGLHLLERESLSADRADAFLPLVDLAPRVAVERAELEVVFVAVTPKCVDADLLRVGDAVLGVATSSPSG